jgi:hypothetical protein
MEADKKLEQYLTQLDKSLGPIAVSDRADIVTEIRSHVLEAQDREPEKSIDSILSSLGEPETVANRYLMERGLKPVKPSKTPMVKWLTIGFLGTLGIIALFIIVLIYKFTPLVHVDNKKGEVQFLGGTIDISDSDSLSKKISGSEEIDTHKINKLKITFANGKFVLSQSSGNILKWDCKATSHEGAPTINNGIAIFNLNNAKCEIAYPRELALYIQGGNAKIVMNELTSSIYAKLGNGKVSFLANKGAHYKYDLKVNQGQIDSFESSNSDDAIPVQIEIENGSISKD